MAARRPAQSGTGKGWTLLLEEETGGRCLKHSLAEFNFLEELCFFLVQVVPSVLLNDRCACCRTFRVWRDKNVVAKTYQIAYTAKVYYPMIEEFPESHS